MSGRIVKQHASSASLPLIGRIKIGDKAKNSAGKEYPISIDYFRATEKYANKFNEVFGDRPNKIGIVFITDDLTEACSQYYASWDKGKLWGEGDGEVFRIWDPTIVDKDGKAVGGYVKDVPKTDPRVKAIKGWAEHLRLRFVIPAIKDVLGYWEFMTKGSASSIPNIIETFDFIQKKAGTIMGFPFDLTVSKASGYSPGAAKSYSVVQLIPNRGEENISAIKAYLDGGGDISKIATITMNEKKLLALSQSGEVPTVDAEVIHEETTNQE